ncbi:MAG: DNA topoisomerase I [Nanoarchaeota archaeon]|nr:DNA topoisomerase I [Nanoarchaeota archaeon]
MAYQLLIAEKPQAAFKIATALAEGKVEKKEKGKVPYYVIKRKGKDIVVGCAVGHLFNLAEKEKGKWTYPIGEIEWRPSYELNKEAKFTKSYVDTLKMLAKDAVCFYNFADVDMEGEVIFRNILRFICKKEDAHRAYFSTLTKEDLINAYEKAEPHINFGMAEAGETRHYADYLWGINLSRALTLSVKKAGAFKLLSIGRVQGPAVKIVVDREEEIKNFKPQQFWQIFLKGIVYNDEAADEIVAEHELGNMFEKDKVDIILAKTKGHDAFVQSVETKSSQVAPPPAFDLTTLQTESYRYFGISPKETLAIAQELYTAGLISYPRTSSQKLPPSLGFKSLLQKIGDIPLYKDIVADVLAGPLQPVEGKKSDPAHPAIFATGEYHELSGKQFKVYDLIVRRFLSCFAPVLEREITRVWFEVNGEIFVAQGMTIQKYGWQHIYHFAKLEGEILPRLQVNQMVDKSEIVVKDDFTKPPKRYTEASLIKELERKNLGTKSTRAQIIDNLYQRQYIKEKSIEATTLGIATVKTLEKYCPDILDEQLTRHFEEEMDAIVAGDKHQPAVLEESRRVLFAALEHFREHEQQIGEGLLSATKETRFDLQRVGKCMHCPDGELVIRKGKFGLFVACNKYPACKTTFSVPAGALIKPADEKCKECQFLQVTAIRSGKRPWLYCLNKSCPAKLRWIEEQQKKKAASEVDLLGLDKVVKPKRVRKTRAKKV